MSTTTDRIANWSVEENGMVRFEFKCDGKPFLFFVTPENQREVLKDIGFMAANPACSLTEGDAEYLVDLICEVMELQSNAEHCNCEQCVPNNRSELMWQVMMFVCSALIMAALAVFVLWGAR